MDLKSIVVIVLSSSVIASIITLVVQHIREKNKQKLYIFSVLYSFRQLKVTPEFVNALNMIDIVFRKDKKVRQLWSEFYNLLSGVDTSITVKQAKFFELLTEIARVLGYGDEITHSDVSRFYYPRGLQEIDNMEMIMRQKMYDSWVENIKREKEKNQ